MQKTHNTLWRAAGIVYQYTSCYVCQDLAAHLFGLAYRVFGTNSLFGTYSTVDLNNLVQSHIFALFSAKVSHKFVSFSAKVSHKSRKMIIFAAENLVPASAVMFAWTVKCSRDCLNQQQGSAILAIKSLTPTSAGFSGVSPLIGISLRQRFR